MAEIRELEVWGVRGSFPVTMAGPEFGGNTSCFFLRNGSSGVILDAGTGIAPLGAALQKDASLKRVHILITHLHLDHVIGLFTFELLYRKDLDVCIYGRPGFQREVESLIRRPFWPVPIEERPASIRFCEVEPGTVYDLDGLSMTAMASNHPGGCLHYRIEGGGKSLVYALDCETEGDTLEAARPFAAGSDLLIWDAHFLPGKVIKGWGHSTWEDGLAVSRMAGVRRTLLSHFSPSYDDKTLLEQEALAQARDPNCMFAREGTVIAL